MTKEGVMAKKLGKPTIKKKGFLWICQTGQASGHGKTPGTAYDSWCHAIAQKVRMLERDVDKLIRELAQAEKESEQNAYRGRASDAWIAERICHYNQRCIDYIWSEKKLPSYERYVEWTGRKAK